MGLLLCYIYTKACSNISCFNICTCNTKDAFDNIGSMILTLLHVYLSLHCRFIVTKCNILSKHPVFAIYKVLMKKAQVREFVCYVLVIIAHLAMGFSSLFCLFMIQHYMSVKEWFSSSQFSTDKFC